MQMRHGVDIFHNRLILLEMNLSNDIFYLEHLLRTQQWEKDMLCILDGLYQAKKSVLCLQVPFFSCSHHHSLAGCTCICSVQLR